MKPKVVIIGGGYAGVTVARNLRTLAKSGAIELVLLTKAPFLTHKLAGIRAAVLGGNWADSVTVPLDKVLKGPNMKLLLGVALRINEEKKTITYVPAHLDEETAPETEHLELPWDLLICCTGAQNQGPGDLPFRIRDTEAAGAYYAATRDAIFKSQNILLIGGGPVSIELAGEIRDAYDYDRLGKKEAFKEITIVSAGTELFTSSMQALSPAFFASLRKKLEDLSINIKLNSRVVEPQIRDFPSTAPFLQGERVVKFADGSKTSCDLILLCAGWKILNSCYPSSWLASSGELLTNDNLLVASRHDVFALGDITNLPQTKLALHVREQVGLLVANVKRAVAHLQKGKAADSLSEVKYASHNIVPTTMMFLPIGPKTGVSQYGTYLFGSWMTRIFKGGNLGIPYYFGLADAKPPKAQIRKINFKYPVYSTAVVTKPVPVPEAPEEDQKQSTEA